MSAFGAIALTLSGGGTRAAGFHLGVLDGLHRVGLLEDVRIVSSASGGSFVNATYALALKQGKPFAQYLAETVRDLREGEALEWVLQGLAEGPSRTPSARRSFVTALAEVYDRHFFRGARFGILLDEEPRTHVREVAINATEAKYGLAFRFQNHGRIGNDRVSIDPADARHIRVADIMAASSDIAGGLEPLMFPQDFVWEGEEARRAFAAIRERLEREHGVDSIPLMDGGVYDNQGIEAVLLALERMRPPAEAAAVPPRAAGRPTPREAGGLFGRLVRRGAEPGEGVGLFIVSDTALPSDPVYRQAYQPGGEPPLRARRPPPAGGLTLGGVYVLWWSLVALCALTVAALAWNAADAVLETRALATLWHDVDDVFARLVPLGLAGGSLAALVWVRRRGHAALGLVDGILRTEGTRGSLRRRDTGAWQSLRRLSVREAWNLLAVRATALLALVEDLFMDRIRSLGYTVLYGSPAFKDRVIGNEIYGLFMDGRAGELPEWLRPAPELRRSAEHAARLPTAFWFERPGDLDTLLDVGRATVCHNLLRHILDRRSRGAAPDSPEVRAVEERARAVWEEANRR
jgi:hypothetical protein